MVPSSEPAGLSRRDKPAGSINLLQWTTKSKIAERCLAEVSSHASHLSALSNCAGVHQASPGVLLAVWQRLDAFSGRIHHSVHPGDSRGGGAAGADRRLSAASAAG